MDYEFKKFPLQEKIQGEGLLLFARFILLKRPGTGSAIFHFGPEPTDISTGHFQWVEKCGHDYSKSDVVVIVIRMVVDARSAAGVVTVVVERPPTKHSS